MKKLSKKLLIIPGIILLAVIITLAYFKFSHKPDKDRSTGRVLEESTQLFSKGDRDSSINLLEGYVDSCDECQPEKERLLSYYFQEKRYDDFLENFPEDAYGSASLSNMRAYIAMQNADDEAAKAFYEKAISISAGNPTYYINYIIYLSGIGDLDQAMLVAKEGLGANPKSTAIMLLAATTAKKQNNTSEVERYANMVLSIDPDNEKAQALLD